MTITALIELLKHEQFHDCEDVPDAAGYRAGWNARSRSLIRLLQEAPVEAGLRELVATAPEYPSAHQFDIGGES